MGPFLVLTLVELAAFGIFAPRMGFYHDDWINLFRNDGAGGLWGAIKVYAHVTPERPMEMLQYPLLFAVGGLHPLRYQIFFIAAEILEGWLSFKLFDRLLGSKDLALSAAVLILVFPTHSITHVWWSSAAAVVSIDLTLASMLLHLRWAQNRRQGGLFWAQALYLFAVLDYEIAAFLPAMLAGGLLAGRLARHVAPRTALRETASDFLPYAATLASALIWERGFAPHNLREIGFSFSHFQRAFAVGLECMANRPVHLCQVMMPVALQGLGWKSGLAAIILGSVLWRLVPVRPASREALCAAAGACVGGWLGACLPFALSAEYTIEVWGMEGRTNAVIAIAGGLLWAAVLAAGAAAAARRRSLGAAPAAVFGLALVCMVLADWGYGWQWERSWQLQKSVVRMMSRRFAQLPQDSTILATGFPIAVEPGNALIFDASYDISSMMILTTNRKDLRADVPGIGVRVFRDFVAIGYRLDTARRYPYKNLYLYRYDKDALWRVDGLDPSSHDRAFPFRRTLIAPPS